MKACKKGGKVEENEEHEKEGADEPLKHGGKVKKAHHAHGGAAKHRLDKRARGGKITPKSPLSGAAPSKERPGFSEKAKIGKESD